MLGFQTQTEVEVRWGQSFRLDHRAGVQDDCGGFTSILSGPETALVLLGAALSLPGWQGLAELVSSGRKAFMLSTDHIAGTTVAEIARV